MDISKAYDCLDHDLLLAKLDAYGFSGNALILICSYLSDRRQRVNENGTFSAWCYSKNRSTTRISIRQGWIQTFATFAQANVRFYH